MPRNKPLIVLETYQGGEGWNDWIAQFKNVATVNDWNTEAKLNWIKVCLAGRVQKVFSFQSLPEALQADCKRMKTALMERFEPACEQELYNAMLQVLTK